MCIINDGVADNYGEITEAGAFVDNGITVLTGKGYADVNAAVTIATNGPGTLAANDEGILVFYDTSTLKTEVYYFNDADGGADYDAGEATLYVQLTGVSLDDLANFEADNFIV